MNILILDMDGTVRIKKGGTPGDLKAGFIQSPDDQEIIPGAAKAIESYAREGWLIVGASNQGGVAAGYKTFESCIAEQLITRGNCPLIDAIFFCPDDGQKCFFVNKNGWGEYLHPTLTGLYRKPEAGMLMAAIWTYKIEFFDFSNCLFVGDRPEDEQAAAKAGIDFQWAKDWWR